MEQIAQLAATANKVSESDKPSPEEIAAFIDGRLSDEDRSRLERYCASNAAARRELIEATRIVATLPPAMRRNVRWMPFLGVAAAAAIVVFLVRPLERSRVADKTLPAQRGAIEQAQGIVLLSPGAGESIPDAVQREFRWRSVEGATYRLIVSDASGKTLLQQNTSDTVFAMPAAITADHEGTYYWSVDALEPDGSSITSGVSEFTAGKR